jgi:hypothetical protein
LRMHHRGCRILLKQWRECLVRQECRAGGPSATIAGRLI